MKVLLVNSYDVGGAANACLRLHDGLLAGAIDTAVLLKNKKKNTPNTEVAQIRNIENSNFIKLKLKIARILKELKIGKNKPSGNQLFIKRRSSQLEMFSYPCSNYDITEAKAYKEADIVNLHWVADFLDHKSFFKKNSKPVVWTLHDMHPLTGGEHYEEIFLGINKNGEPEYRVKADFEIQESIKNLNLIKDSLQSIDNLIVVAPSRWLANEAKKSFVFKNKAVFCIPNGIDSTVYQPRDKGYSRALLNIPIDKKVILFVADSISNNRKGFVFLKKAFEQLTDSNLVLCAIGQKNDELHSINNILELGPIYDERLMSIAYSAADVFVIPSLMDNLPNTVLESLMCGTPVVGFPVGGVPDMIQDGINGILTKEISVASLLEALTIFLSSAHKFDRDSIREDAVKKYDIKIQAASYIKLFEDILKNIINQKEII